MRYLQVLAEIHRRLEPPTYLEVGIRKGSSLALSRTRSVGIAPAFTLQAELDCDVALFRATSDDYFSRPDPLAPFGGRRIAMSFIDGMHLSEYALRDFMNVESHADWNSVIVFDDMFPRDVDEAARDRHTRAWAGDVYKMVDVLREYRPDLMVIGVDSKPTGLLVVLGADPANTVLRDNYESILARMVTPDPQEVSDHVLQRKGTVAPKALLDASFWDLLRRSHRHELKRSKGLKALHMAVHHDLGIGRRRTSPVATLRRRLRDSRR